MHEESWSIVANCHFSILFCHTTLQPNRNANSVRKGFCNLGTGVLLKLNNVLHWNTGKFTRLGRRSVVWASLKPLKRGLYRTQQRMYQNGYKTKNVANIQIYWLVFELLKLIKGFTYKKALKSVDVRKVESFCVILEILWLKYELFCVQKSSIIYVRL